MAKKYALYGVYDGGGKLYVPKGFPMEILNLIVDADGVPAIVKSWPVIPGLNQNPATEIYALVFDPRQTKDTAVATIEAALDLHYAAVAEGQLVVGAVNVEAFMRS